MKALVVSLSVVQAITHLLLGVADEISVYRVIEYSLLAVIEISRTFNLNILPSAYFSLGIFTTSSFVPYQLNSHLRHFFICTILRLRHYGI